MIMNNVKEKSVDKVIPYVKDKSASSDKKLLDQLKLYEGKKISLPKNKDMHPNKDYLRTHRNEQ